MQDSASLHQMAHTKQIRVIKEYNGWLVECVRVSRTRTVWCAEGKDKMSSLFHRLLAVACPVLVLCAASYFLRCPLVLLGIIVFVQISGFKWCLSLNEQTSTACKKKIAGATCSQVWINSWMSLLSTTRHMKCHSIQCSTQYYHIYIYNTAGL